MTARTLQRGAGITLIAIIAIAGLFAPWLTGQDPNLSSDDILAGISVQHWLGTDDLGRDVYARILYGARISLVIGPAAMLVAVALGVPIGLLAGYTRGKADAILVQFIDLFLALPSLILVLIVTVIVGASLQNIVLVLGFVMWPEMARLVRGQVRSVREGLFVEAARSIGAHPARILALHIWPNIMRVVAAQMAVMVSSAIFTAASLGFLGLGLPPPAPDWGSMVHTGFEYLALNPLLSLAPGAAVALTVVSFYLVGQTID